MTKFVPLNKQSKREQKAYHAARRGNWNGLCPVTRIAANKKAYDRARIKQETRCAAE